MPLLACLQARRRDGLPQEDSLGRGSRIQVFNPSRQRGKLCFERLDICFGCQVLRANRDDRARRPGQMRSLCPELAERPACVPLVDLAALHQPLQHLFGGLQSQAEGSD